jgi:cell wall-associated NlpC family hydrolase
VARAQAGDPYVYGADGPNAFDCSGLTSYAYKQVGRYLPHNSQMQWNYVRHIKKSHARRGDLVFFLNGNDVYHVAILAGRVNGRPIIWHASRSGTPVKRDPIWTRAWRAGTLRHR